MNIPNIYLPYRFYGFDLDVLKKKLLKDLSCYNLVETDKVTAAWRPLPWDSKHFGRKMLELRYFIAEEDASLEDRSVTMEKLHKDWQGSSHVTARINAFDILSAQVAESLQFSLMDTNVKYGIDLRKASSEEFQDSKFTEEGIVYDVIQCPCPLSEVSELVDIAKASWSKNRVAIDRFHGDASFSREAADSVYSEWLKNSLTGELADEIIVPRLEGKAVGFLGLKHHADNIEDVRIGSIGLGAVDLSMRGENIYTTMISLGLRILMNEAEIVETGTQITNYPAQRAWVRMGFGVVSTTYVFHKWLTR